MNTVDRSAQLPPECTSQSPCGHRWACLHVYSWPDVCGGCHHSAVVVAMCEGGCHHSVVVVAMCEGGCHHSVRVGVASDQANYFVGGR